MNFFAHETAAERYAKSRPYFHPLVMEKIKTLLPIENPVDAALDVGCGTGQSTVALKMLAHSVVGVDASSPMIAEARTAPAVTYLMAPAENIPLPAQSFDLLTVSLAFHWFDRERFLAEAHRLLKPNAHLVIYNNGFYGKMHGQPRFENWNQTVYLARYPSPPRKDTPFTDEDAQKAGFRFLHRERYENAVDFTPESLAAYLTTQSNVIAHVEQGNESVEEVYAWLRGELMPFFIQTSATFQFGGSFWLLQRI